MSFFLLSPPLNIKGGAKILSQHTDTYVSCVKCEWNFTLFFTDLLNVNLLC